MAEDQDAQRRADAQAKADAAAARVAESRKQQTQAEAPAKPEVDKYRTDPAPATGSTKSANKPLSIKENADARSKVAATNRWATIKHVDEAFDKGNSRDEVINISIMENGPPEVDEDLAAEGNKAAERYSYQQVGPGVVIGMRAGGEYLSADGFGWRDVEDYRAHGSPAGAGSARLRDMA